MAKRTRDALPPRSTPARDRKKPLAAGPGRPKTDETSGLIGRTAAARRIGCSIRTLTRLEHTKIAPVMRGGVHYFRPEDVERLRQRRAEAPQRATRGGLLAAALFARFAAKQDLPSIVAELRVTPAVVREAFAEYSTTLEEGAARARRERNQAVALTDTKIAAIAADERRKQEIHERRLADLDARALAHARDEIRGKAG